MLWLLLYTAFFSLLSLSKARLNPKSVDFYARGRGASGPEVAFSLLGACVGGSATIGMIGLAADVGTPAFWWLGSGCFGFLALAFFLAKKIRASGALTLPEILTEILGPTFRRCSSALILAAWFAILAAQLSALGVVVDGLAGVGAVASVFIGLAILLFYTLIGGQAAIMRSDVWQFLCLVLALLVLFYFICQCQPARSALAHLRVELFNDKFPLSRLRYFLLVIGCGYLVGPTLFVCLLSARSPRAAVAGPLLAAPALALIAALITLIGVAAAPLLPLGIRSDSILPHLVNVYLPPWAAIVVSLGLYSAILSSADSCLMTAASICANDLLRRPTVTVARVFLILLALAGAALALRGQGIVVLLLMAYDIFVCGIVAPVFVALLFPARARAARPFFFAAMIGGGALGVASAASGIDAFSLAGLAWAFAASGVGAAAGGAKKRGKIRDKTERKEA